MIDVCTISMYYYAVSSSIVCVNGTICALPRVALEVLSGEGDCLKRAAAQHEKLMPSITR